MTAGEGNGLPGTRDPGGAEDLLRELPGGTERTERLRAVLHALYLVFNEGYTATGGDELTVPELSREAIRLTAGCTGYCRRTAR